MNIKYALILSFYAGLSTMIGSLFIFINHNKDKINKYLSFFLGLSSSIMIMISIMELLPKSILFLIFNGRYFLLISIILISLFINKIINENNDDSLYRVGVLSCIIIFLHNVPEGIITFLSTNIDYHLGIKLAVSIAMHNIPEGIIIAMPIYYATFNKRKAFLYTFIASIAEVLGAIITYFFLSRFIKDIHLYILLLFVGILMINIAINNLLPRAFKYDYRIVTVKGIVLGIFISILLLFV